MKHSINNATTRIDRNKQFKHVTYMGRKILPQVVSRVVQANPEAHRLLVVQAVQHRDLSVQAVGLLEIACLPSENHDDRTSKLSRRFLLKN